MKYYSQIVILLALLVTIPIKLGFFVHIGIIVLSLHYFFSKEPFKAFLLSFSIYFLIPYNINTLIFGFRIGNYLDNAFLTSFPLLICLPFIIKKGEKIFDKRLKFIMMTFFVILFYSTLLKGAYSLFLGGERVRITVLIYFLNGFLLMYWGIKVLTDRKTIKDFIIHIIILGTIASFIGIIQFFFKTFLFEFDIATYELTADRLFLLPLPDPVACFPFIVIPFSFAVNYLLSNNSQNKNYLILSIVILCVAQLFTLGRWGLATLVIVAIFSFWIYRKKTLVFFLFSIISITIAFIPFNSFITNSEMERLESRNTLIVRMLMWNAAIETLKSHLILGVGLGNAATYSFNTGIKLGDVDLSGTRIINPSDIQFQSIHSFFLEWILSMGLLVVFPILYMYYLYYKNYKKVVNLNIHPLDVAFVRGIIASLIGITIFWLQNSGDSYNWLFLLFTITFILKDEKYFLNKLNDLERRQTYLE